MKQKGYHDSIINGALNKLDELASYHNKKILTQDNNSIKEKINKVSDNSSFKLNYKPVYKQDSDLDSHDSFSSNNIETTFSLSSKSENLNKNYLKNKNVKINNNLF